MIRGTTSYHVDNDDIHVILNEVPAWVRKQCGEVHFEAEDVTAIQEFVYTRNKQAIKLHRTAWTFW